MSSPTINFPQGSAASLETICNLVRSLINDTQAGVTNTPGEGQIFTDNPAISPFVLPLLNSSIRELYRELRNIGDPVLLFDNVILLGLPPLNSPSYGVASPDPTVQTILSTVGYFDGVQQWPNLLLPSNMINPIKLWERQTGTENAFQDMTQPQDGLSSYHQGPCLREWEWRNSNINFHGATQMRDIRMRYFGSLPQFFSSTLNFNTTYVPVLDSTDALAYLTAVKYARMLGSPSLADLMAESKNQLFQLKNATVRRMQSIDFARRPYGNSSGDLNNEASFLSW